MALIISDLVAGYGGAAIVKGVGLSVEPGRIVAIAGTNGSGKSTLVKAVMGLVPKVEGKVDLDGTNLLALPAEARVAHGLGYVPQVANVFTTLSVWENLAVVECGGDRKARIAQMFERFPALAERKAMAAGHLSGGERQQLAFARALMLEPKYLILDEPTAALSVALVEQVFTLIRELPQLGIGVLLVEQRARLALEIADDGIILDQGSEVMAGPAAELLEDNRMAELYLGHAPT
ncbi:MAG: ABC transporter ATP-binding protein [Tepidamorphaceae bacterium]|nr:ABC transporter ATP-binding protein [Rhodobiaceae bacterium]MCC0049892.1 ABC transporter ATP-binding protein [Rhodobiaceae bacterium]